MYIRRYMPTDCVEIAELFYQTVHAVNAKDYTEEQLDVWAMGKVDLKEWNQTFSTHVTMVAVKNGIIVGFGDMDDSGYLDRLYVHKDFQNKGIVSAICDELEHTIQANTFITHASVTARSFFEYRGYRIKKKQQVIKNGISLTNFIMEKQNMKETSENEI